MKKQSPFFFVFIAAASFFALSCGSASGTDNPYVELPYNVELSDIQVDVSSALQERNGKNYKKIVFSYPTRNVAGESVRASAIIVMPSECYNAEPKPEFDFTVLMNHGATTAKKNVPSHGGNLADFEKLIAGKKAVGVAADYIGFESSGQIQAFAFGDVNARTIADKGEGQKGATGGYLGTAIVLQDVKAELLGKQGGKKNSSTYVTAGRDVVMYSSDLKRAKQTAAEIAGVGRALMDQKVLQHRLLPLIQPGHLPPGRDPEQVHVRSNQFIRQLFIVFLHGNAFFL